MKGIKREKITRRPWTRKEMVLCWDLYLMGYKFASIGKKLGARGRKMERSEKEVRNQTWKMSSHYDNSNDRDTIVATVDRRGFTWSRRDLAVLKIAKKAKAKPLYIANLLGRSEREVKEKILRKRSGPSLLDLINKENEE